MGGPENEEGIYPNFIEIAKGFGVPGRRIIKREDLRDGMREMLDAEGPYILEVIVPHTDHVMPMIPQGKSAMEILIK
jgi:acetolactate synthase-1/2/3 large subunit